MQKLILKQSQIQRLSPQQIQFIKLLQIPTVELTQRIEEELEANPALEEFQNLDFGEKFNDNDENNHDYDDYDDFDNDLSNTSLQEIDIKDYQNVEEYAGYKMADDYTTESKDFRPVVATDSLHESLNNQLGYLKLNEREEIIGSQLIGSIEDDGYIRRPLRSIRNDLAFTQNFYTSEEEIEDVLKKIQKFEPPGIGARDLQECLILQIERKPESPEKKLALILLENYFDEFTKKHYTKLTKRLGISDEELKNSIQLITRLNPKPGNSSSHAGTSTYLMADFIVTRINGKLEVILNSKNAPDLQISKSFADMLKTYSKVEKADKGVKETLFFVKEKIEAAKWFIDAIKQRQDTLIRTMKTIVDFQSDFFEEGNESSLKPMILKDIAEKIDMDISTVSRVVNSKSVQTDFGLYPLKYFFSEGISTDAGEDASSIEVKNTLQEIIDLEDKKSPHSDEKLEKLLRDKGYQIARRTVAKYREKLGIPVARLRKEI